MTSFDSNRGRVWAVLIGLMGGMIIGLPLRSGLALGHGWHHGCDAHCRHHGGATPPAPGGTAPGAYVTIPPSPGVRVIHVAPGVGVRLDLDGTATRDPFTRPSH